MSYISLHILCTYAIRPRDLSPSTYPDYFTRYSVHVQRTPYSTQSVFGAARLDVFNTYFHIQSTEYVYSRYLKCSKMHVHMYAMLRQHALVATVSPLSPVYERRYRILHIFPAYYVLCGCIHTYIHIYISKSIES